MICEVGGKIAWLLASIETPAPICNANQVPLKVYCITLM